MWGLIELLLQKSKGKLAPILLFTILIVYFILVLVTKGKFS